MDWSQRFNDMESLYGMKKAMQNGLKQNLNFSAMNLNDETFRKYLKLFLCSPIGGQWRSNFDYENGNVLNCSSTLAPQIKMISFDYWHVE